MAQDWFERFEGSGFDGVMAKPTDGPYVEDRRVQFKVKHHRTADCVVAGYRVHKEGGVGSLLLGLFDDGTDGTVPGCTTSGSAAHSQRPDVGPWSANWRRSRRMPRLVTPGSLGQKLPTAPRRAGPPRTPPPRSAAMRRPVFACQGP